MKNIVLIGMMGSGKSTVGALLADALDRELADTDQMIEAREGCTIPELFARRGERYFRDREQQIAEELAARQDLVIACGGGLPLREACIAPLRESGTVFFLARDPAEIYDSVPMEGRPLAQEGKADFVARFARREPVYRRWAHHIITDFSSPEATAKAILEAFT